MLLWYLRSSFLTFMERIFQRYASLWIYLTLVAVWRAFVPVSSRLLLRTKTWALWRELRLQEKGMTNPTTDLRWKWSDLPSWLALSIVCQPIFRQVEIELVGRVGGRTFDERNLEFEVGEGLNVNIPRSNDYMQIYSRIEGPCLFYFLCWPQGNWICTGENEEEGGCWGEIFTTSTSMSLCGTFTLKKLKTFLLDSRCH